MKLLRWLLVLCVIVVMVLAVRYLFHQNESNPEVVACTMEAKICPDGSAVGRTGPNCEFAPCPGE